MNLIGVAGGPRPRSGDRRAPRIPRHLGADRRRRACGAVAAGARAGSDDAHEHRESECAPAALAAAWVVCRRDDRGLARGGCVEAAAVRALDWMMYEAFFGLRERPFDLTPNPRFLLADADASRGAEQPPVRCHRPQGADPAHRRSRRRQDDADLAPRSTSGRQAGHLLAHMSNPR